MKVIVTGKPSPGTNTGDTDKHADRGTYDTGKFTDLTAHMTMVLNRQAYAKLAALDKKPIRMTLQQYFIFTDSRTGASKVQVWQSGFQIVISLTLDASNSPVVQVQKTPLEIIDKSVEPGGMAPADTKPKQDPIK